MGPGAGRRTAPGAAASTTPHAIAAPGRDAEAGLASACGPSLTCACRVRAAPRTAPLAGGRGRGPRRWHPFGTPAEPRGRARAGPTGRMAYSVNTGLPPGGRVRAGPRDGRLRWEGRLKPLRTRGCGPRSRRRPQGPRRAGAGRTARCPCQGAPLPCPSLGLPRRAIPARSPVIPDPVRPAGRVGRREAVPAARRRAGRRGGRALVREPAASAAARSAKPPPGFVRPRARGLRPAARRARPSGNRPLPCPVEPRAVGPGSSSRGAAAWRLRAGRAGRRHPPAPARGEGLAGPTWAGTGGRLRVPALAPGGRPIRLPAAGAVAFSRIRRHPADQGAKTRASGNKPAPSAGAVRRLPGFAGWREAAPTMRVPARGRNSAWAGRARALPSCHHPPGPAGPAGQASPGGGRSRPVR